MTAMSFPHARRPATGARLVGLGLLAMALTACQTAGRDRPAPPMSGGYSLSLEEQRHSLPVSPANDSDADALAGDKISPALDRRLRQFLASSGARPGDQVYLTAMTRARMPVAQALKQWSAEQGLDFLGAATDGTESAPLTLVLETVRVKRPACGRWPREHYGDTRNTASLTYGCATTATLGAMIANPRDLKGGHTGKGTADAPVGAIHRTFDRMRAKGGGSAASPALKGLQAILGAAGGGGRQ
ncbi:CpaD family pilus assembly lipoprotein [Yunchengibacter salinarum]|uniref:CpaD family pilus assembly lipoprotein n=1 Tax=Yunchengibacter salinarum TaxID=3133399 RepID=UPI0035B64C36